MGIIEDALDQAVQGAATRPMPRSAPAQMRALVRALHGTRAAAEALGITQRTVERYVRGQIRRPRAQLASRLEGELRRRWQPRVKQRALRRARQTGVTIETRARFGFTAAAGSTDDPRVRRITQHLPPAVASALLDAHAAGRGEQQLRGIVADGLGQQYFRDGGRRAPGLTAEFTDVDYADVGL